MLGERCIVPATPSCAIVDVLHMSELLKDFVTASHAVLFEDESANRCEVCSIELDPESEDGEEGYALRGQGLLVWTRGDERRTLSPPLCPSCAAAIGVSALHRWEIEEEEG